MTFEDATGECGVIAILRGVTPDEVVEVARALHQAGIRAVEVPLNSPEPFMSIQRLAEAFAGRLVCGAGTVLTPGDVDRLKSHGGTISVSPDCNPAVIARAVEQGLEPLPGVFTPTEALSAIRAGARHLKLFPAEAAGPQVIKAWRAVLPRHVKIYAVGGVTPSNMQSWIDAGAAGFGIGSNIYKPGWSILQVTQAADAFVSAWQALKRT